LATDPIRLAGGPSHRAAGERAAELFEQHGRMVYGLCRMLLRDPVEADDATQATFVSAFRSLLGGATVRDPAAWLSTIARNECRGRSHARMREPLPLLENDVGHARSPHEEVKQRIAVTEIREAIAELPEKQREAVVLRDLYGLRYDEVGAALGLSRPSVEALLFRARRRLRVSLKPLAGGALAVPLAVREGIAQALPGVASSAAAPGALAGGVTASAAGGGLLAKLTAAPVAAKLAAVVAVGAAGSAGVVGAERVARHDVAPPAARQAPLVVATHPHASPGSNRAGREAKGDDVGPATVSLAVGGGAAAAGVHGTGGGTAGAGAGGGHGGGDADGRDASAEKRGGEETSRPGNEGREADEVEKESSKSSGGTGEHSGPSVVSGTTRTEAVEDHPSGGDDHSGDAAGEGTTAALDRSEGGDSTEDPETETPEGGGSSGSSSSDDGGEHEDAPEAHPEETEPPA
jgi:RNA polymerase sigma factor (sigma-70 family)